MHPELVYRAAERSEVILGRIIFDAFQYNEIHISKRRLLLIHNQIVNNGIVHPVVEDYVLNLLAGRTHQQININCFSEVPIDYEDWSRYVKRRNL